MMGYILRILVWLDEGFNTIFFSPLAPKIPAAGSPHYTVSQTMAELRERGSKFGCVACKALTAFFGLFNRTPGYDHCTAAMQGMPEEITSSD